MEYVITKFTLTSYMEYLTMVLLHIYTGEDMLMGIFVFTKLEICNFS